MKIKKVALGNEVEAYVESRFGTGVTQIFSNDNNKGKTVLLQGLMFSIGHSPIFPDGLDSNEYFFYSEFEINNRTHKFLRRRNSIIVIRESDTFVFNSVTEFRYFFDEELFKLPRIKKDGRVTVVDLPLFYETFFVGQDERRTSNLISATRFNKEDFKAMVYTLGGAKQDETITDIDEIKSQIKAKKGELKTVEKRRVIVKDNPDIERVVSTISKQKEFQDYDKGMQKLHKELSQLERDRNRENNRKYRLISLISELRSLNRNLDVGKVKCAECGSESIVYSNGEFSWDISTNEIRQEIIDNIQRNIEKLEEIALDFEQQIEEVQKNIRGMIGRSTPEYRDVIVYQEELKLGSDVENEAKNLRNEISYLEIQLKRLNELSKIDTESFDEIEKRLIQKMNELYHIIDPIGKLVFEDLFSVKSRVYSGSDGQEFYFSKIAAINEITKHPFPLIIDSFRDGELSSPKEERMIEYFKALGKQVVLSSTVKNEEYESKKYVDDERITFLDFSDIMTNRLLSPAYTEEFKRIVSQFNGVKL
ncbi:MAG: hypothetical protein JXR53_08915 [Bacteroidales bacterium]|nr:hypothetical protein [Bacteroidales bacterium]